jgi:hypothetical protein
MADGASNGEIGHLIMQDTKSPSQALSSTFLGLSFAYFAKVIFTLFLSFSY